VKTDWVNIKQLQEYENIFRSHKMAFLWREYLSCSSSSWARIELMDAEQLRLAFHSWKSSSQIFGMDEFVRRCAAVEEKLSKHLSREDVEKQINGCRECYQKSIAEVEAYFNQKQGGAYGQ